MAITRGDVLEAITKATRLQYVEVDGGFEFDGSRLTGWDTLTLTTDELDSVIQKISSFTKLDETAAALESSVEMLVRPVGFNSTNRLAGLGLREEGILVSNSNEGVTYVLGGPSEAFLVYILTQLSGRGAPRVVGGMRMLLFGEMDRTRNGRQETSGLLEALCKVSRLRVLRIESDRPIASAKWGSFADDLFFHIAYSMSVALTRQRSLDELLRRSQISGMRNRRYGEFEAPKRTYISDLVYHYQLGLAADNLMLEYLSYYHVIEHWFELIFHQNLVNKIQSEITDPSFSYKRAKDIQRLIKIVTKSVQEKDDELIFNEQTALKLTIERYVDIGRLVEELDQLDPGLVDYYASNSVDFCSADKVGLRDDSSNAVAALSRRIYKLRNALVHSKDGSKARYIPFSHDEELVPEVTLVRFVAEQIIISTSELRR